MSKKIKYAVVGTSAYKLETTVTDGELAGAVLFASYPGGSTKIDMKAAEAVKLINDVQQHAVNKEAYEAQIIRNKPNYKSVQKRAL
jgi:hypothetical protein